MKNTIALLALGAALATALGAPALAEQRKFTDDAGRAVTVDVPVKRAAIFNRYNVEYFRGVGAMDAVIGMDSGSYTPRPGYWPGFDTTHFVGVGQTTPNYEAIIQLKPDLVVVPRNGVYDEMIAKLTPFNIPVMVITGWDTTQHYENVKLVGAITGHDAQAQKLADFYKGNLDLLATRLKDAKRPLVYVEQDATQTTMVPGSAWHDMVVQGGGSNVFGGINIAEVPKSVASSPDEYKADPEQVIAKNPDVIVKLGPRGYLPSTQAELADIAKTVASRPGWSSIAAVRNKSVYVVSGFAAGSMGLGASYVAKELHPDLFKDLDPDKLMRRWMEEFQGIKYDGRYDYSM